MVTKILNQMGDPRNKETYKQMLDAFDSVGRAEDSGALDSLKELTNKFALFGALLQPLSDLLDPFTTLADIFSGILSSELADTLETLFTIILSTENIALVKSIASNFADLFENVLTEDNLNLINTFIEGFLDLIDIFGTFNDLFSGEAPYGGVYGEYGGWYVGGGGEPPNYGQR